MTERRSFLSELRRRNVLRAVVLYVGGVWALSQGVSQLAPALGLPDYATRWFLIACVIVFPFWVAFAWYYEFTPKGFKRDDEVPRDAPARLSNKRTLDFAIIGVLVVAVALLASGYVVPRGESLTAAVPPKSIAVLPFQNLSSDKANEYFVAGMQDLILTKLADIGDLKVISRASTTQYASHPGDLTRIGQQLGVATILEGSVQKAGNQVMVTVQLIDTRTDAHIWAQSYQRTLDNVFGVEGEVAEKVAKALKAKLSPTETALLATDMSHDPVANNLFLGAEFLANQGTLNYDTTSWKASIPLYRQAIDKAPGFALAYARVSFVESALAWFGGGGMDVKQLVADARGDAERAVKLAPKLSASHVAIGYSDYFGQHDYAAALQAFDAALKLRPNDADTRAAVGYVERRQGHFDAAVASLQRAFALNPRKSSLAFDLGYTLMMAGHYPDAQRWLRRALALDPGNRNAQIYLSNAILLDDGNISGALAAAAGNDPSLELQRVSLRIYQRDYPKALALLDSVPDTPDNFPTAAIPKQIQQAELYRLMGDTARAQPLYADALPKIRAEVQQQQGYNQATLWQNLALAELGLGHVQKGLAAIAKAQAIADKATDSVYGPLLTYFDAGLYAEAKRPDLALPLLARALASPGIGANNSPVLLWLDPGWDPIRKDPGFQALLKKYARFKPTAQHAAPASS